MLIVYIIIGEGDANMKVFKTYLRRSIFFYLLIALVLTGQAMATPALRQADPGVENSAQSAGESQSETAALSSELENRQITENARGKTREKKLIFKIGAVGVQHRENDIYDPTLNPCSAGGRVKVTSEFPGNIYGAGAAGNEADFVFWPTSTFDSRLKKDSSDSDFAKELLGTFSEMVDSINSEKGNLLSLTTTYRDNPISADDMKRLNFMAGEVTLAIDTEGLAQPEEMVRLSDSLEGHSTEPLKPLSDSIAKTNKAPQQAQKHQSESGKKAEKAKLLKQARRTYEKNIARISDIFSAKVKAIQAGIKKPVITEDAGSVEMIISISRKTPSTQK